MCDISGTLEDVSESQDAFNQIRDDDDSIFIKDVDGPIFYAPHGHLVAESTHTLCRSFNYLLCMASANPIDTQIEFIERYNKSLAASKSSEKLPVTCFSWPIREENIHMIKQLTNPKVGDVENNDLEERLTKKTDDNFEISPPVSVLPVINMGRNKNNQLATLFNKYILSRLTDEQKRDPHLVAYLKEQQTFFDDFATNCEPARKAGYDCVHVTNHSELKRGFQELVKKMQMERKEIARFCESFVKKTCNELRVEIKLSQSEKPLDSSETPSETYMKQAIADSKNNPALQKIIKDAKASFLTHKVEERKQEVLADAFQRIDTALCEGQTNYFLSTTPFSQGSMSNKDYIDAAKRQSDPRIQKALELVNRFTNSGVNRLTTGNIEYLDRELVKLVASESFARSCLFARTNAAAYKPINAAKQPFGTIHRMSAFAKANITGEEYVQHAQKKGNENTRTARIVQTLNRRNR